MNWNSHAPSNIALIKYMGKSCHNSNLPANPSLSYALDNLITRVSLEKNESGDRWESPDGNFQLPESSQSRYTAHLKRIKRVFGSDQTFTIRSSNNFPTGAGIASSASSFAALSLCANAALSEVTNSPALTTEKIAQLSRQGSGSSIRSFYTPWSIWEETSAKRIDLPYPKLIHQIILLDSTPKKISSSEAHRLIESSTLYPDRLKIVRHRLDKLIDALFLENWQSAFKIVRDEFIEMHELFHTAKESFSYLAPESRQIIREIEDHWSQFKEGPLMTMDAGPNIHLLYRPDQEKLSETFGSRYRKYFNVL